MFSWKSPKIGGLKFKKRLNLMSFERIYVRLKVILKKIKVNYLFRFERIYVRLKVGYFKALSLPKICFERIYVRLKVACSERSKRHIEIVLKEYM